MRRGDIVWADVGRGFERRPTCIVSADRQIERLSTVMCAPITTTVRGLPSEVEVGIAEGLQYDSVVHCDNIVRVPKTALASRPVGYLDLVRQEELDDALCYALGIRRRWLPGEEPVP